MRSGRTSRPFTVHSTNCSPAVAAVLVLLMVVLGMTSFGLKARATIVAQANSAKGGAKGVAAGGRAASTSMSLGTGGRKIYFAGSIRGGRKDVDLYQQMIDHMKEKHGTVLTEHIAHPDLLTDLEMSKSDKVIYAEDMTWLKESELVVAEVTQPSLGVGYELGQACAMGKPVLALFRPASGLTLSAMIGGDPSVVNRDYLTLEEALDHIDEFVGSHEG